MAKRHLPPHIVLPNGQWRFVKRGSSAKTHKHRGVTMRKHRIHHRRSTGIKSLLAHGIAPKIGSGLVALGAAAGLGYFASIANDYIPQFLPMQKQVAGTLAGGIPGFIASFFTGGSSSGSYGSY